MVLGWPVALLLVLVAIEWYLDEIYVPTIPPPNRERVQHTTYHSAAVQALDRFRELSASEREAILENLNYRILPLTDWWPRLRRSDYQIVCLGEDHDEYTRRFLANDIFSEIVTDVLLLEATPKQLARIMGRVDSGKPYVRLLDADIAAVIRTARRKNPSLIVNGIEETGRQEKERQRLKRGSRDETIAANLRETYRSGRQHVILFGALHCKTDPAWLFGFMRSTISQLPANAFLNVRVMGEHQNGPLEAFVYFLDEVGIATGDFVIAETGSLHPFVKKWFSLLNSETLSKFQTMVVFRS